MSLTGLLRAATELALRLERLRPGVLDGPVPDRALARRVDDEPRPEPRDLVADARRLRRDVAVSGLPDPRRRYLEAVLSALDCHARLLAGERPGYVEEVRALFGVVPRRGDPDGYREVHRRLGALLPGHGPVAARMGAYRDADVVPPGRVGQAVAAVTAELRGRVHAELGLPAAERATVELVGERPWTAFTRYRGGFRSRVSITTATRLRGGSLLPLLAHELYPGHHTQYCRAELAAPRHPELALRLVHGPLGLVAEGAAEAGVTALPGPGWGAPAERALARAGVRIDGGLAERIEAELDLLGRVRQDAALLRYVDNAGPDEVTGHLSRWLLIPEARARRILAFLDHPQWRGYAVAYAEGAPLVRDWLARYPHGPVAGLRTLLDTPVLPADLLTVGGGAPRKGATAAATAGPSSARSHQ
ncbi:DUF885 domain-containing protein [Pseudonocardia sp. C8]|uniref:DUF885 domain-containing protein n=1 Tax=Pseudonocardia sp. C8 TaxID=2762759 RepID=UPI0016431F60|nr:DUF885 domain-containing protein [Pseudonocardia sp. C8]MBC3190123.1 DUF885 domain-containing protein [Pseudonocardia sp. C8]